MHWKKSAIASLVCLTSSSLLYSADAGNSTQLQQKIIDANTLAGDKTINFTSDIDLTVPFPSSGPPFAPNLRPINTETDFTPTSFSITLNGNGFKLLGGDSFRGFFARGGIVTLNNIKFIGTASRGGNGGDVSGGGGAGIGGALIIDSGAVVTATQCTFQSSKAVGGNGGLGNCNPGAGGGGGLGGNGGTGSVPNFSGGGGGGLDFNGGSGGASSFGGGGGGGVNENGVDSTSGNGGRGGNNWANANGGAGGTTAGIPGQPGGNGGGGGGGPFFDLAPTVPSGATGGIGGGGGGGGAGNNPNAPGAGMEYGGGGGAGIEGNTGGAGGFCGGGGGGGVRTGTRPYGGPGGTGGAGGFGGGSGGGAGSVGTAAGSGGVHGFGGGTGGTGGTSPSFDFNCSAASGGGGGGAGFGGAIFIRNGGNLTLKDSVAFGGNSVAGGTGGAAIAQTPPNTAGTAGTDGTAAGTDIFMMSGSFLTFDLTINSNVPNPIEGDQGAGGGSTIVGGLTKLGCAQLILTGDNTYTGTTNVNAGELRIDGSVITPINVAQDALLSGNFTVTGNVVNNGTLAPGNGGVGQVTINGDLTNGPNSFTQIDITPIATSADLIIVSGTANLQGTLNVVVNAGNYIKGTQYTVINGTTIGTFDRVIETGVNAGLIDIDVTYSSVILTVIANRIFQNQTINSGIPSEVANCIRNANIIPGSDFANVVQQLGLLSNSEVNRALINLSPVNYGALDWINARNNNYLAYLLSQHLFKLCCSPRDCCGFDCNASVWIDVFGNLMNNRKHYNNLSRFSANAIGVVTGLDYCFCQNWTAGAAFAYTHTWLDWKGHHGHGDINSYYGALYGSYQGCYLNIDASLIGGGSDHDLNRRLRFSGTAFQTTVLPNLCGGAETLVTQQTNVDVNRSAKSSPWGYFFTGHLGMSVDWDWCCITLEPFGLVDYNYFRRDSFKEHGADSLNLKVKEHNQNMLRGEAGLRAFRTWACECFCWAPYLGVSWVGEFPLGHSKQKASFVDQSCVFDVNSYHSSVQLVSPEAGIKWTRNSGFSFLVGYKGLFNDKTSINEVEGGIEWIF